MTSGTLKKSLLASVGVLMFGAAHAQDVERVEGKKDKKQVENIIVTGSNIKGISDQFSPVTSITRDDIDLQGFTTVEEVLQNVPQNFNGGDVALDRPAGPGSNGNGHTGVNLRGVGAESSLVLINGRRMAHGSGDGNFVDISAIPISAIERVDVLTDGASAIYGSDAVAGVVNIILRDDFEGVETRLGYDTVTDGSGSSFTFGQTLGVAKGKANGLITYQYNATDPLLAGNKSFATGKSAPGHEFTPFSQKHNIFALGGYQFTDQVRGSVDLLYSDRKSKQFGNFQVVAGNEESASITNSKQFAGTGSLYAELNDQWDIEVTGTYSASDLSVFANFITDSLVSTTEADYETLSGDILVTGELPSFSSEAMRIAFGAHGRSEEYERIARETLNVERDVTAFFGELYAPLVTESDGISGIHRLALSAAVRRSDYSDAGASTDPKFGVVWSPAQDFTVRGTYGTSFRAPSLKDAVDSTFAFLLRATLPEVGLDDDPVFLLLGSTSDLDPEESEHVTIGFDWTPSFIEGFSLRATYFDIDYTGRLGRPRDTSSPDRQIVGFTGPITTGVTPAEGQSVADSADVFFNFTDFFPTLLTAASPTDVVAILDGRKQNFAGIFVGGYDVEGSYTSDLAGGALTFNANATILTEFDRQQDPTFPVEDELDTYNRPNSLRVRAGATWAAEDLTLGFFMNHTGDYIDNRQATLDDIGAWTTFDASMSLELGGVSSGSLLDGAQLSLNMRNILNEDPPALQDVPLSGGSLRILYDGYNADPYGRRIGINFVKTW